MRFISLISLLALCACSDFHLNVDAKDGDKEITLELEKPNQNDKKNEA